jgi:thiol-disulfide isomerase/thioredoxin
MLWRAIGDTHEYSRMPLTGPVLDTSGGGSEGQSALRRLKSVVERYGKLMDNLQSAQVLRQEELDVAGTDVACTVVRAEYAPPRSAEGIRSVTRTFWIDTKRNLLVQEESLTTGSLLTNRPYEYAQSRHRTRFTTMVIGVVPDALFTYTPPANYREVDTLEGVMQRRRLESKSIRGKPAPDFTAQTLDGKPVALSGLRGKPVLLDFWATWCAPCVEQMPALAALYREAKEKGLVLIGVNDDEAPEKALAFVREKQYDWPSVNDHKDGALRAKFNVFGIPTLVLIDGNGIVVEYQTGFSTETDEAIRAALRKVGVQIR